MKRELAWYPGIHSNLNHLYDLKTGAAICGSTARRQTGWKQYWRELDCENCVRIADKIHNEEREAEEMGDHEPIGA